MKSKIELWPRPAFGWPLNADQRAFFDFCLGGEKADKGFHAIAYDWISHALGGDEPLTKRITQARYVVSQHGFMSECHASWFEAIGYDAPWLLGDTVRTKCAHAVDEALAEKEWFLKVLEWLTLRLSQADSHG